MNDKNKIGQADMMRLLDGLYDTAVNGLDASALKKARGSFDGMFGPVDVVASSYLSKSASVEVAAKSYINCQVAKCGTAGFLTGLGGFLSLPVAVPANIASVLFFQLQMIATLARMGGFDVKSEQVRTMAYMCLADVSMEQVLKQSGIRIGERVAIRAIEQIPCELLAAINKRVGFCLVTKFGRRGVINLGRTVPLVGGVISGGLDGLKTKQIAGRAYEMFIEKNGTGVHTDAAGDFYDVDYTEI